VGYYIEDYTQKM